MKLVSCPTTGRVFDLDAVQPTPYKLVPGTGRPADMAAVEGLLPELGYAHPLREARKVEREQAIADLPKPVSA